jgi:glycosyltransferase involved in cell wall biosynthesis
MDDSIMKGLPKVSVVIPMKNESRYITKCLQSVVGQDYPSELVEIFVVDGGSHDGSVEIVKDFATRYGNIHLRGGKGINCPAGMNIGIREASGSIIAKVDAHGFIAKDYLSKCVQYLTQYEDVKCVGGLITPVPETVTERANALARASRFGVGRGIYSLQREAQFSDTVQCGVYQKDVLEEVGFFDEELQFGEDEELNWRIRKKGYRIFVTPEVQFYYIPRNTFCSLFKQYWNYGKLRIQVIKKHADFIRIKHLVPSVFIVCLILPMILAPFVMVFRFIFFSLLFAYIAGVIIVSLSIGAKGGWPLLWRLPVSFAALHFGYGFGFLDGIVEVLRSRVDGLKG